jgi:hypothetical protein
MTLQPKHSSLPWIVLLYSALFHPSPKCDLLIIGALAVDGIGITVCEYVRRCQFPPFGLDRTSVLIHTIVAGRPSQT